MNPSQSLLFQMNSHPSFLLRSANKSAVRACMSDAPLNFAEETLSDLVVCRKIRAAEDMVGHARQVLHN
jgi:hypothetical protein